MSRRNSLASRRLTAGAAIAIAALVISPSGVATGATKTTKAAKAGASCSKAGTKSGSLVCTKVGNALKWQAPSQPATTAAPAATTAAAKPTSDRILRVVVPAEPASLNPLNLAQSTGMIWGAMFEAGLIALDTNFRPTDKGIVTAWKRSRPDTWRFTIRSNVKFHNGEPFDSAAMKFTLDTYKAATGSPMRPYLLGITSITAVDALTLDVTTSAPDLSIPAVFTAIRAFPPKYYTEMGAEKFGQNPVGVGPFVFKSWTPGTAVEMKANPNYWRGTPGVAGLRISFAPDAATRASLLQTKQADLISVVPVQLRKTLNGNGTKVVEVATRTEPSLLQMSTRAPLTDNDLRKAVALAMDRKAITDFVLEGKGGKPAATMLGPLYFDPVEPSVPAPNMEKAKSIVKARSNPSITLSWAPTQFSSADAVAEAVAGMLDEAGFKVKRNPLDPAELTRQLVVGSIDGLVLYPIVPVFPHPKVYVQGFLTTKSITKACTSPGIDTLNDQGIAAENEAASDKIFASIESAAVSTDNCVTPLYYDVQGFGMRDDVAGFTPPPAAILDYFTFKFTS